MSSVILHNGIEHTVEEAFTKALACLQQGVFLELIELCRKIVTVEPGHFRAHHGIGIGLSREGNPQAALPHIRRAIELNPGYFEAYNNLGNALLDLGDLLAALEEYRRASELRPEAAVVHLNLAKVQERLNLLEDAAASYERVLVVDAASSEAMLGLAGVRYKQKRFMDSLQGYLSVGELFSDSFQAAYGVGMSMVELITINGGNPQQVAQAAEWLRTAARLEPDNPNPPLALANLLSVRADQGDPAGIDEAVTCYQRALELKPEDGSSRLRLGNLLLVKGRVGEALDEYRRTMLVSPDLEVAYSCYAMSLNYHPGPSLCEMQEAATAWYSRFAASLPKFASHANVPDPDRPLRIGYVSADFRWHPVGFHLMPVLYSHDATRFEVFCYYNSDTSDVYTARLRACCHPDGWRNISKTGDEELVEMIRADGIDILVDLSGHTSGNRLPVFARKPAPVQVTWLGYFFSTGVPEIDYIFMDDNVVLSGEEKWFTEEVVLLPGSRFCYEPPPVAPDVAPLPADSNGHVTFGSFNNLAKVTDDVVQLWAQILRAVPDSHLLLKAGALQGLEAREEFIRRFYEHGITADRLILRSQSDHMRMLREYGDMDIALDPFPFNGGVTTCEALWMGVPVVTLFGSRPIARQTTAFLRTIGLEGFVAEDAAGYCKVAQRWAASLGELRELRAGLRRRMKCSPLCNGKAFTATLEAEYRDMWRAWCAGAHGGADRS